MLPNGFDLDFSNPFLPCFDEYPSFLFVSPFPDPIFVGGILPLLPCVLEGVTPILSSLCLPSSPFFPLMLSFSSSFLVCFFAFLQHPTHVHFFIHLCCGRFVSSCSIFPSFSSFSLFPMPLVVFPFYSPLKVLRLFPHEETGFPLHPRSHILYVDCGSMFPLSLSLSRKSADDLPPFTPVVIGLIRPLIFLFSFQRFRSLWFSSPLSFDHPTLSTSFGPCGLKAVRLLPRFYAPSPSIGYG